MSWSLLAGILWVVLSAGIAMLPIRRQYAPGLSLMILAPAIIGWITLDHGWLAGVAALAAFVSMYRHPLRWLWSQATGRAERKEGDAE